MSGERDSGYRRGSVGQRVEEGTGMAEAPVATPVRLLLLLLGQQGHKAMGARVRGGRGARVWLDGSMGSVLVQTKGKVVGCGLAQDGSRGRRRLRRRGGGWS